MREKLIIMTTFFFKLCCVKLQSHTRTCGLQTYFTITVHIHVLCSCAEVHVDENYYDSFDTLSKTHV